MIRELYRAALPAEARFWLYKLRHRQEVESVRTVVYESPKGNFSLRGFDRQKSIFVHVPKAAGTSVALALFDELPYHYAAWQYRVIFGRRLFSRYFKFAFVRNPWDRLYSAYSYLKAGGWNDDDRRFFDENLSALSGFEEFVVGWLSEEKLTAHTHFKPQYAFVTDGRRRILLDYLGYFETLQADFDEIAKRMGVEASLEKVNASPRASYLDAYSEESRRRVADLYATDIDLFGYEFNGVQRRQAVSNQTLRPA